MRYFQTRFLEEADKFIAGLDLKSARKVFYNIDLAEQTNDPKIKDGSERNEIIFTC